MTGRGRDGLGPASRAARVLLAAAVAAALPFAAACGDRAGEPSLEALTEEGVSRTLAGWRADRVDSLRYDLGFRLPEDRSAPVRGSARITFLHRAADGPVILDFAAPDSAVRAVESRGEPVEWELRGGHLVIPSEAVTDADGRASVRVEFLAGDGALNRNDEYLYTLFVPARARETFPCFDQPDLKGRFRLTVEAPEAWRVVSNTPRVTGEAPASGESGAAASHESAPAGSGASSDRPFGPPAPDRRLHRFDETPPLPTYLFSFAAGRFEVETAERDGRTLRMLHRETDAAKVRRNREAAFDLHAAALEWLEEYTGIPYPFGKFDFVLVPSFQYGGMEHPGAVLYRASRVLLDEGASKGEELGRASLIAHETAHMWFGDLVTMEWFDDVWMKEVFANFMAAKIVHPSFPEMDHDLRFLLDHHPAAYGVDRSGGTHPIRQELPNLADAGSLYGAIIYRKAPAVLRQLEALTGEEAFRAGVRDYLRGAPWGNAGWTDLVAALDPHADLDVAAWSRVWVEEAGRPTVRARLEPAEGPDGGEGEGGGGPRIGSLIVEQEDPEGRGRRWPQRIQVALGEEDSTVLVPARLEGATAPVEEARGRPLPEFVLPGAGGLGYGRFVPDSASRRGLLDRYPDLRPAVARAAAWLSLREAMLEGEVPPERMVRLARDVLLQEDEELLVEHVLSDLSEDWWRYLDAATRRRLAPEVEAALLDAMRVAEAPSLRTTIFRTYRRVAITDEGVGRLRTIWEEREPPGDVSLSERDYSELAQELAVRGVPGSRELLEAQAERISNPDRRERFRWVMPALSPDPAVRDSFFDALSRSENREHEPWVLEGVGWLHHPLRAAGSRRYVAPALELLREVRATGDIFFPRGWLDATLRGHGSPEVARTIRRFLEERPDYPEFLEDKLLQAADPVFRAARIRSGGDP